MTARRIGWYVWAFNEKGKPVCVSGCFETQAGAEEYHKLYKSSYPNSEPYIEQRAIKEIQP